MRILPVAVAAVFLPAGVLMAQTEFIKPYDFQPLTSLPWKTPNATLEGCLNAIFREPDPDIRYPVLGEYLETLSEDEMEKGFDISIRLEGAQMPDALVEFYLEIWAQVDPEGCWRRTKDLFLLVGYSDSWPYQFGWGPYEPRIPARNLAAIRASPFWIDSRALKSFPLGVERSALPDSEQVALMRKFANTWWDNISSDQFDFWPGYLRAIESGARFNGYNAYQEGLTDVFSMSLDQLRAYAIQVHRPEAKAAFEAAMHRWLQAQPSAMPEILKALKEAKWQGSTDLYPYPQSVRPSGELLLQWAKADQPAMVRWADSPDLLKNEHSVALQARGMLMSRVDLATRNRWLAEAGSGDDRSSLLQNWAVWDPNAAVQAAVQTDDPDLVGQIAETPGLLCLAFDPVSQNTRDWDWECVGNFAIAILPPKFRSQLLDDAEGAEMVSCLRMINSGDAARYGVTLLSEYDPRNYDAAIRYFSGEEVESEGIGVPRETLSALREWAIVRPTEMKAWIATLTDAKLQKALTWLLNHPWGRSDATAQ